MDVGAQQTSITKTVDLLEFSYTTISVSSLGENASLILEVSGEWSAVTPYPQFSFDIRATGTRPPGRKKQ